MVKNNVILVEIDNSCSMASVSLNKKCIMEENFWDFHPGCHGINEYGDFKGYRGLANAIVNKLIKEGKKVEILKSEYKYED